MADLLRSLWSPHMGDVSLEDAERMVQGGSDVTMTMEGDGEGEGKGAKAIGSPNEEEVDSEGENIIKGALFGSSGSGKSRMTTEGTAGPVGCEVVPANPTERATPVARRKVLVDALLHQPFCIVPEPTLLNGFAMLDRLKAEWHADSDLAERHESSIVDVWAIFRQPLLTQDLQMMAVAVMTVSKDLEAAVELLQVSIAPSPLTTPPPLHPSLHNPSTPHNPSTSPFTIPPPSYLSATSPLTHFPSHTNCSCRSWCGPDSRSCCWSLVALVSLLRILPRWPES